MDRENYVEGCSMQRPPSLEPHGFCFGKPALRLMLSPMILTCGNEETIDSRRFTRFNVIVTSLKSLDQDYSKKNHVRKILRAHPLKWRAKIMDSGCTKHKTENRRLFTTYKEYDGGHVVFESNLKGKVIGGGQLCDDDCDVRFTKVDCTISKNGNMLAKVLNKETIRIEESLNITFDESLPEPKSSSLVEDDGINIDIVQDHNRSSSLPVNVLDEGCPKSVKEARGNPIEQVICDFNERILRSKTKQP
ncbi:hypothetical protein Tco_0382488 [Tanacetum coccineum]